MDVLSPTFGSAAPRSDDRRVVSAAQDPMELGRDAEIARLRAEVEWLRAERDALAWAVGHDDLTGLANRRLFQALGPEIVAREPSAALMVVDLDGFKPVNDTYGHDVGDEVLRVVARRMARWGGEDLMARIGGDEFAGVLTGERLTVEVLASMITEPIRVLGRQLRMTASIGIAPVQAGASWVELLRRADLAMYQAKMTRSRYAVWDGTYDQGCLEFAVYEAEALPGS